MSIDIRHNEHWPKGCVTVFISNGNNCGCYFGPREDGTEQLRKAYPNIQYVCINTEDWDATVKWLEEEIVWTARYAANGELTVLK